MFFDEIKEIPTYIDQTGFSIISADPEEAKKLLQKVYKTNVFFLSPDEKTGKISIEQIRDFVALTGTKDKSDKYFVVLSSEKMNTASENAFLKNLEEPKPYHHFVLVTKSPSAHLPTILSRAHVFYQKQKDSLKSPISVDEKTKNYAKKLITADSKTLIELGTELSKKKDNPRDYSLKVIETAIEILYKSYFATNQEKFLKKLPNLLNLYENISKNGHIKLHFVADMI